MWHGGEGDMSLHWGHGGEGRGDEIIQLTVDPSVSRQDIADNVTPSHLTIACDAMCDANLCGFSDEIIKKIQSRSATRARVRISRSEPRETGSRESILSPAERALSRSQFLSPRNSGPCFLGCSAPLYSCVSCYVQDPGGLITHRNAACSAWQAATGKQFILTLSKNIPGPGRTSARER